MLGLFAVGEYAMQFRSFRDVLRRRSGKLAERWSLAVVLLAVVGGFVGGIKLAQGHAGEIKTRAWPLFVLGLGLMAVGIAIRWWAIVVLGRFFTPDVRVQASLAVLFVVPSPASRCGSTPRNGRCSHRWASRTGSSVPHPRGCSRGPDGRC